MVGFKNADTIEGIINLRSLVIRIITMRKRFGLADAETNNRPE